MGEYSAAFDVDVEDDNFLNAGDELDYTENVIFLVDASPSMFTPVTDTDVQEFKDEPRIIVIMKTICNILKTRIIKSPSDQFGLVFYSAAQSNSPEEFENVRIALEMDFLSSGSIQNVSYWCNDDGLERLAQDVGSAQDSNPAEDLKYGLWQCQKMFSENKNKKISRHVMLFSALDDPCQGQQEFKQQIMGKIQSLRNANVRIDAFPLLNKEQVEESGSSSFWKEVVSVKKENEQEQEGGVDGSIAQEEEGEQEEEQSVYVKLEDLQDYVVCRQYKKRTVGTMMFKFYDQIEMAMQIFAMVRPGSKGRTKYLHLQTNEVLESKSTWIRPDTGAVVQKQDIQYKYEVSSGAKDRFPVVVLTEEEMKKVKHPKEAGLVLLGFQSMHLFRDWWQLAPSNFCYPNEKKVKGSTAAFIALYTAMQQKDKFAICRCVRRAEGSPPVLVALVPQVEELEEGGLQVEPPGFQMHQLPFMDSLRAPEDDPAVAGIMRVQADKQNIDAAKDFVNKYVLEDFSCSQFSNPHLQRHYQVIEAVALDQPVPSVSSFQDNLLPDQEGMQDISEDVEIFKKQIYGDTYDYQQQQQNSKKRSAPASSASYGMFDWEQLARTNKLNKLTVVDLKLYLVQHRLGVSGKKADLIDRIKTHLNVQ